MPFHVICLDNGKPLERDGAIVVLETGQEAARVAQEATAAHGARYQPRRVANDVDWRAREQQRFESGQYLPIPDVWADRPWWRAATLGGTGYRYVFLDEAETQPAMYLNAYGDECQREEIFSIKPPRLPDHFAHPSSAKDGMVAFTEDADKGAQDRQTRMTPGRYLTRYFADVLSTEEIAHYAALYSAEFEDIQVKITQDADEIERVYTNGPTSCMSRDADYYETDGVHPARVYAGPDLGVAFIEPSGGISARCVVWPERKIYSRIYGDETRLERLLTAMDYKEGSISGARVQKIETDRGCYVMPYVDGCSGAGEDGKYIRLGRGDIDCGNTNGLGGSIYSWHCDHCEDGFTDDDSAHRVLGSRYSEQYWCEHCCDSDAFYCAGNEEYYAASRVDSVEVGGQTYCTQYADAHFTRCEATDEYVATDDSVILEDGTVWSADHFSTHGHTCGHCGCLYDAEDIQCTCEEDAKEDTAEDEEDDSADTYRGPGIVLADGSFYRPRQGIDANAQQIELDLRPYVMVRGHRVCVGDLIYLNDGDGARCVCRIDVADHSQPVSVTQVCHSTVGYTFWPPADTFRTLNEYLSQPLDASLDAVAA